MSERKDYDYYIFLDYSEDLIGYNIIEQKKIITLLPKISRFEHYKGRKNRKIYLKHIGDTIKREKIKSFFEKIKIEESRKNVELFTEVLEFIKIHKHCILFLSVDDYQFKKLSKLLYLIDGKNTEIKKESQLKKGTPEYQVSLVIDNLLNIERRKQGK
ncbi:MAG TPA: hypothetical protein VJB35_00900 [Candidatus Nanoarchaeia archaeon]|nr:hypothetical protein [uncultured archaeon]HLD54794.1 hypothetical protein [Candidatus Nanoarchaeia archaeon]